MTWLGEVALRASLMLVVGLGVYAALRYQSAALRHAWLAATLGATVLVAPLSTALPALPVPLPATGAPAARPQAPAGSAGPRAGAVTSARQDAPHPSAALRRLSPTLLPAVWAVGTLVGLALLARSVARLVTITRRAAPVRHRHWADALAAASQAAALPWPVDLRVSPEADLLATWGWRRSVLLVPRGALRWPRARIDAVLAHELAHVRRADWVCQVCAGLVRALLWWNPLVWVACQRLALESERACDDAVLSRGIPAHAYASHLVAIARDFRERSHVALAIPMARPSTLHRRITAMLDHDIRRTEPGRLTLALVVAGVLLLSLPVAALRGAVGQAPLEGVVYDPTGAVLPEVRLVLTTNGEKVQATTDAEGRFVFAGVQPGPHVLEAELAGFKTLRQEFDLRQPQDWNPIITLPLGHVREQISVRGRRGTGAAQPTGPVRVRVGGNVRPPMKLVDVKPVYPDSMREAGREGVVTIDAVIDRDGSVTAARVTSAHVHPDLAIAALDAVRQWKFAPTLLNGTAVEVVMTVSVSFTLE